MNLIINCSSLLIVTLIIIVLIVKEVGLMPLGIVLGVPFIILIGFLIWFMIEGSDE